MNNQNVSEGIKNGVSFLSLGSTPVCVLGKLSDDLQWVPFVPERQETQAQSPIFTSSSQDLIKLNNLWYLSKISEASDSSQ